MPQLPTKVRILATRPLSEATIAAAKAAHIAIDTISFIQNQPVTSPALTLHLVQLSTMPLIVAFTSANAVIAVRDHIKDAVLPWKIACLSGKTLQAVTQYFPECTIIATAGTAEHLASYLVTLGTIQKLYFFCSNVRLDILPATMKTHNIKIEEQIVYHTVATPVTITEQYSGILFFSPSAVQSFCSVNTIPAGVTLFAIGATTAAALAPLTSNQMIISPFPNPQSLINAVISFYQANVKDNS